MALGQAQRIVRLGAARKVGILDNAGNRRWSPIWEGQGAIARLEERADVEIRNGSHCRPYIAKWGRWDNLPRIIFTAWRARDYRPILKLPAGILAKGRELRETLGAYVVVEPNIKGSGSPNKSWGLDRFQAVVDGMPMVRFVQFANGTILRYVTPVKTQSYIEACGYLAAAAAYVGLEGGLHHAAAALNVQSVVIYGGFSSPESTGYPDHHNIYIPGPESPCGRWAPCAHCQNAMASITPERVRKALTGILQPQGPCKEITI